MFAASILASFVTLALATPRLSPAVVHERRAAPPSGWSKVGQYDGAAVLPLRFGLAQANLERLEEFLLDVSHPDSPNYGQHWSPAKVASTFAPSDASIASVSDWLAGAGVHPERVRLTAGKAWLELNATVAEAEKLLATTYHVYEHAQTGAVHVGCESYSVPEHVSKHIDVITPTVHFDRRVTGPEPIKKRLAPGHQGVGAPGAGIVVPESAGKIQTIIDELENCDKHITPNCLRALYGLVYPVGGKEEIWASKNESEAL